MINENENDYDDVDNEYTWYNKIFNDSRDKHNNPVGGDSGLQETNEGYIENNYIAKYIVKIFLNKNHVNHIRNLDTVKKYKKLNLSNFNKFFN